MDDQKEMTWAEAYTHARSANDMAQAFEKIQQVCAFVMGHEDAVQRLEVRKAALEKDIADADQRLRDTLGALDQAKSAHDAKVAGLTAELDALIESVNGARTTAGEEQKKLRSDLQGARAAHQAELHALQTSLGKERAVVEKAHEDQLAQYAAQERDAIARLTKAKQDIAAFVKSIE